jgi:hypothetical protein
MNGTFPGAGISKKCKNISNKRRRVYEKGKDDHPLHSTGPECKLALN